MKKITLVLLSLALLFGAACSSKTSPPEKPVGEQAMVEKVYGPEFGGLRLGMSQVRATEVAETYAGAHGAMLDTQSDGNAIVVQKGEQPYIKAVLGEGQVSSITLYPAYFGRKSINLATLKKFCADKDLTFGKENRKNGGALYVFANDEISVQAKSDQGKAFRGSEISITAAQAGNQDS